MIRKILGNEEDGEKDDEKDEKSDDRPSEAVDDELDKAMLDLVAGTLPAFIYCENAMDVGQALELVEKYELKPILVVGKDCYKAVKQIAAAGVPVILDSTMVFWESDPRTDEDTKIVLTEKFREYDVPFAFQTARSSSNTLGNNYLWYQAATAVKYGMPREDAIKSLTLVPATILGVDKFTGSLEVGKDGDVVILTGDPLKIDTWVETTVVNGKVVYQHEQDEKLKRLLGSKSEN